MVSEKMHEKIRTYVHGLQTYADRIWYPPMIGFLAAIDNLVLIIPTDGILISSSMLIPKRWLTFALNVAIGSTLGGLVLASLVEFHGLPWVLQMYPGVNETHIWAFCEEFFHQYGLLLVFIVALTPFIQQPAVILAGLANTSLLQLVTVLFVGRLIKFLIMSYLGSHAPRLLKKLWGLKGELKDAGVQIKD
ncbi:MAG: hypothetical protein BroJett040_15950 [Oligoflexia bacterium]|nr:MAG: hypothetical protein BroJett040_15950 [Oligoflexia bacterium]